MSAVEDKQHAVRRNEDDVARQTLGQLRDRWGVEEFAGRPDVIAVVAMGRSELWRRAENGTKGEHTTYELQRSAA